jgi:hypothetical protein
VVLAIRRQLLHLRAITAVQAFIILILLVLVVAEQVLLVQTVATMLLAQVGQVAHHLLLAHQLLMQVAGAVEFDSLEELLALAAVAGAEREQHSLVLDHPVHQTPVAVAEVAVAIMGLVVAVALV